MSALDNLNKKIIENRPSWDEYFKEIVNVTAKRSPCKKLHVGCLLVKDKRIISQGYNGYLPGCKHEQKMRNGHEMATIHAEQNAITDCAKRGVCCLKAHAYITHYPCIYCMKILCAAGIEKIFYIDDYKNDELIPEITEMAGIMIEKI